MVKVRSHCQTTWKEKILVHKKETKNNQGIFGSFLNNTDIFGTLKRDQNFAYDSDFMKQEQISYI